MSAISIEPVHSFIFVLSKTENIPLKQITQDKKRHKLTKYQERGMAYSRPFTVEDTSVNLCLPKPRHESIDCIRCVLYHTITSVSYW